MNSHLSLKTPDGHNKACDMVKLIKDDYGDRMVVFLLRIEVMSAAQTLDSDGFCDGKSM